MKRIIAVLVAVATFGCLWSGRANAQQWPPDDLGYGRGTYSCPHYFQLVAAYKTEYLHWWTFSSFPDPNAPATITPPMA